MAAIAARSAGTTTAYGRFRKRSTARSVAESGVTSGGSCVVAILDDRLVSGTADVSACRRSTLERRLFSLARSSTPSRFVRSFVRSQHGARAPQPAPLPTYRSFVRSLLNTARAHYYRIPPRQKERTHTAHRAEQWPGSLKRPKASTSGPSPGNARAGLSGRRFRSLPIAVPRRANGSARVIAQHDAQIGFTRGAAAFHDSELTIRWTSTLLRYPCTCQHQASSHLSPSV